MKEVFRSSFLKCTFGDILIKGVKPLLGQDRTFLSEEVLRVHSATMVCSILPIFQGCGIHHSTLPHEWDLHHRASERRRNHMPMVVVRTVHEKVTTE